MENFKENELPNPFNFMKSGEDAFVKNVHEKLRETLSANEKTMWINGYLAGSIKNNMDKTKQEPKQEPKQELTFGEEAIGLTFNPSGDDKVNKAKQLMADALDLLKEAEMEKADGISIASWESNAFINNAFNKIVDAQMALVKYITWKN